MGINEQGVFPEIDPDKITRTQGMNITLVTNALNKDEALELLKLFGNFYSMQEILEELGKCKDIEKVLKQKSWQTFEQFVAWVFEQHDFATKLHVRFGKAPLMEIDVLAEKGAYVIAVECKRWKGKSQTPSKLLEAAAAHEKKCKELSKLLNKKVVGIIVTLLESGILMERNIIFVPIFKLNRFLLHLEEFI